MNTMYTTKTAEGLPKRAFLIHPSEPGTVIRVLRGESGYYIEARYEDPKTAQDVADKMNGPSMTKRQLEAMLSGSMFGWSCPGADPETYNEDGSSKKLRKYNIAFQGRVKVLAFSHRQACKKAEKNLARVGVESIHWGGSIDKEV
jgi:hypothetical protein